MSYRSLRHLHELSLHRLEGIRYELLQAKSAARSRAKRGRLDSLLSCVQSAIDAAVERMEIENAFALCA
jgi:hypothetical protein